MKSKCIAIFAIKIENLKKTKITDAFRKTLGLSIVYSKCDHGYKKIFKEHKSIEILKTLDLINDIEVHQKIYDHAWRIQEF